MRLLEQLLLASSRAGKQTVCCLMAIAALAAIGVTGQAVTLATGAGPPDLRGWCVLDWNAGCTTGLTVLSGSGLTLRAEQNPPASAFEISLKLIPLRSLLFVLDSPSTHGRITFSIDGAEIQALAPPSRGAWWVRLTDLPETGILRLELNQYCNELTIRSVRFGCPPCPEEEECQKPENCLRRMLLGAVIGAGVALVVCWLVTR